MGRVYLCDGCGTVIDGDPAEIPLPFAIKSRHYGACCIESVRAYGAERDRIHTGASDYFRDHLSAAREEWRKTHPGKLPDEL